ncbi:unnamed protein product [Protopolystoma xenopodis]|uniref:Uncharacterized protein n=1 Tax=Protopolystoma xenopodis TaxID=117903 RepID=A0A3S5BLU3_9PLAT|nr:unnamed protein product [Protopolystoma xenopodis]
MDLVKAKCVGQNGRLYRVIAGGSLAAEDAVESVEVCLSTVNSRLWFLVPAEGGTRDDHAEQQRERKPAGPEDK